MWCSLCGRIANRIVSISVLLSLWFSLQAARALPPDLFWDPTAGANGPWDNISANWSPNAAGGAQTNWQNGSNAVFSASGLGATGNFAVTLTQNIIVGDLTYTDGNLGGTLQISSSGGRALTMANPQMNVTVDFAKVLTVASAITGAGELVLQNGFLVLTGANTYSGGTTIAAGTLQLGNDITTGSIIGVVVNNDAFNIVNANTAGITSITNNVNGTTTFSNATTAGTATINNEGGVTAFANTSSAGNAAIANNGGFTEFFDTATAGTARITNSESGFIEFFDRSTAGGATIIVNSGGETEFNIKSTAGAATIINNPGGLTRFNNNSTAGTASVSNNGAETGFFDSSTAGNATITINNGGSAKFFNASTGGEARFITNSGGIVDISGLSSGGMTAGSIEGPGDYFLGSKVLTVGLNNLSTMVSGLILDGGTVIGTGGSLVKTGAGRLTLTGPNTYSGGTGINGGVLAVNSDSSLGTGPLSFGGGSLEALAAGGGITLRKAIALRAGGGTFLADSGTNSTLSGLISGAGSLTKGGPGTLVLTGPNIYQGGTILNAGTLTVNGAQALGLGNLTVNGGILKSDPQPINVRGNYTQNAGSTLQLQLAGANPGQYDTLSVGGNAALGGTLQLISLGYQPKAGDQLTLITAGRAVSGHFAQFLDPFGPGPGYTIFGLVYEPNAVLLEFRTAASFALTPNQRAAAGLFDAVHLDPRAANLISFFNQEPFANLPGDFERISPDGLTALYEISFSNANIQRLNLESRLDDLRTGSNGFSSNMKVNGSTVNDKSGMDGKSSKAIVEPILQHGPENRWGVWVTGFGDFVSVESDGNGQGYNFTTGGVSLGIDYRITDQLAIGVMGDYTHTWTALNSSGHLNADGGRGGLYATYFDHGIYLNGGIYGGYNSYDSGRAGLGSLANGSTEGAEWSTFVSGGYDFHLGQLTVGPIGSLQYTSAHMDGFSENGSLAPLAIHSDSVESLRTDLGFRASYQWQLGKIVIEPFLKAAWEHEYKYSALPITAGFAEITAPSATFFGPAEGHDSAVVSAGCAVQMTPAITIYVNYDGQLGRGNYDSNGVSGGIKIGF
jgi:outer membrane autotransporter protein